MAAAYYDFQGKQESIMFAETARFFFRYSFWLL